MNLSRRALLAVVAAVAVLSAGIGWLAGQRIKSPAEVAAAQAPPDASLITVPVEMRELSQSLVVRGTVLANESAPISATSTSGETIITRLTTEAGAELAEGDVAIEVAGRPVFLLQGSLPVFRSLIPTLDGPDVLQLEEALDRLGHDPGEVDGVYDGDTADAVERLYRAAGYTPVEPTEEELAGLEANEDAVTASRAAVADAERALADANAGPPESTKIQLDQSVADAEEAVEQAKAGTEAAEATKAREAAEAEATTAAARLSQAEGGTHPDTNAPPTEGELAELRADKEAADRAVTEAKAAEDRAKADQTKLVERAETDLALAKASRTEALATDTSGATELLRQAREQLTDAQGDLARSRSVTDTRFPAAELYFLPSMPRKVQSVDVEVGDRPAGAALTVTGSGTTITSAVAAADRRLIEVGDTAILDDEQLGITAEATVSFIAANPGGGDVSSDRYRIRIDPVEELPEEALGVNFRITIPVTSSGGEVMAVPLSALSAGTDGSARVEVERSPGETELVIVTPGLRAQGYVQIDVVDGRLEAGDRVVVGRDLVLPGQSESDDSESDEADSDDDGDAMARPSSGS
jgi:hypothetical protein